MRSPWMFRHTLGPGTRVLKVALCTSKIQATTRSACLPALRVWGTCLSICTYRVEVDSEPFALLLEVLLIEASAPPEACEADATAYIAAPNVEPSSRVQNKVFKQLICSDSSVLFFSCKQQLCLDGVLCIRDRGPAQT